MKGEFDRALEGFSGEVANRLRAAVAAQLQSIDLENLEIISDEDIAADDSVSRSRLTYAVSLMRLLGYLKKTPPTWEFARGQAALALKYVQHAEGRGLKALQLGRTASDEAYEAGVAQLRQEMAQVSSAKARVLIAEQSEGKNGETTTEAVVVESDD